MHKHVAISSKAVLIIMLIKKNAEELVYDTVIDENLSSLFSCYDIDVSFR